MVVNPIGLPHDCMSKIVSIRQTTSHFLPTRTVAAYSVPNESPNGAHRRKRVANVFEVAILNVLDRVLGLGLTLSMSGYQHCPTARNQTAYSMCGGNAPSRLNSSTSAEGKSADKSAHDMSNFVQQKKRKQDNDP